MSLKNTKVKVGKHKSKYKAPKDMEKSLKIPKRKEDYTHDDKDGGMNPYSTKEIQDLVPRKTDKLVIDDVKNMVPEIKHRVYQDVANGKYSIEDAKKIFKKMQIEDTDGYLEKREEIDHGVTTSKLKESFSNLSETQKENAIRNYIRHKITNTLRKTNNLYLLEQEETPPAPPEETPPAPPEGEVPAPPEETPPAPPGGEVPPPEGEVPPPPGGEVPPPPGGDMGGEVPPPPGGDMGGEVPPPPGGDMGGGESPDTEEELSPEEKAKIEVEKQNKVKKDFMATLESEKAADTIEPYVKLGLDPLIQSMKGLSGKKFKFAKIYAVRMLLKQQPSGIDKNKNKST